jgi:hypothetical protein
LCDYCKEALKRGIFIKCFLEIIIMIKNNLSEIFLALKNHHDKKLVLYKKIADISLLSREYLCCNMFMNLLNDVVSIYKGITIDNVVSLSLKISSIKNSGFGVFSLQNI